MTANCVGMYLSIRENLRNCHIIMEADFSNQTENIME